MGRPVAAASGPDSRLLRLADEVMDVVRGVAAGRRTASEEMGHQEFVLTYKTLEPVGPACLPLVDGRAGATSLS